MPVIYDSPVTSVIGRPNHELLALSALTIVSTATTKAGPPSRGDRRAIKRIECWVGGWVTLCVDAASSTPPLWQKAGFALFSGAVAGLYTV